MHKSGKIRHTIPIQGKEDLRNGEQNDIQQWKKGPTTGGISAKKANTNQTTH